MSNVAAMTLHNPLRQRGSDTAVVWVTIVS